MALSLSLALGSQGGPVRTVVCKPVSLLSKATGNCCQERILAQCCQCSVFQETGHFDFLSEISWL